MNPETTIVKKLDKDHLESILNEFHPEETQEVFAVFYLDHEVKIEKFSDKQNLMKRLIEMQKFLQECRIFFENAELYMWKWKKHFEYRIRKAEQQTGEKIMHKLIGKVINGRLQNPFLGYEKEVLLPDGEYMIEVENYMEYDKNLRQTKVIDARLIRIKKKGE